MPLLNRPLHQVESNRVAKGDVLTVAQLAGVMGAKTTSSLIPLCHPLLITNIRSVGSWSPMN